MKQRANGIGTAAALVALLLTPLTSVAQDSPEDRSFDRRWYLGAGAGATRLEPEPRSTSMSIGDKSSTSGSLFFGRDISKQLSVEGHLATLGDAGVNFLGAPVGELDYTVAGISAIRYLGNTRGADGPNTFDDEGLYRREGLSFYARLGLGGMRNSSTNNLLYETRNNVHVMGGVGAEYGFTNGFAVRLEATAYDTDARELSLRVLKRLGSSSAYAGSALAALPAVVPVPAATPTPVPAPTTAAPPLFSFDNVLFAFDKSDINPTYARELESLARVLKDNPGLRVVVEGHTDAIGSEVYNQALSIRRARAVVDYLFSIGVTVDQLEVRGFGETRPVADNATRAGRAQNRRVDVVKQQ